MIKAFILTALTITLALPSMAVPINPASDWLQDSQVSTLDLQSPQQLSTLNFQPLQVSNWQNLSAQEAMFAHFADMKGEYKAFSEDPEEGPVGVPDGGLTLILFGAALSGLAFIRRHC
jgi:hypothetical protein